MLWIIGFLTFAAILIRFFPKTRSGVLMYHYLVELPAKVISKTERKHIIFIIFGLLMIQGFASVVSIDLAILAALDASLYVDILISVGVTAAVTRTKSAWAYAKTKMQDLLPHRIRPSVRISKTKPRREDASPSASNDDERTEPFALAA